MAESIKTYYRLFLGKFKQLYTFISVNFTLLCTTSLFQMSQDWHARLNRMSGRPNKALKASETQAPEAQAHVEAPEAQVHVEAPEAQAHVEAPEAQVHVEAPEVEDSEWIRFDSIEIKEGEICISSHGEFNYNYVLISKNKDTKTFDNIHKIIESNKEIKVFLKTNTLIKLDLNRTYKIAIHVKEESETDIVIKNLYLKTLEIIPGENVRYLENRNFNNGIHINLDDVITYKLVKMNNKKISLKYFDNNKEIQLDMSSPSFNEEFKSKYIAYLEINDPNTLHLLNEYIVVLVYGGMHIINTDFHINKIIIDYNWYQK